ncbi:MAG: NIPSNAP family protein [Burkholderiaceae bacterium]
MIVDYRAYTLQSGAAAKFIELFETEGLEPQIRILGNFLGIYRTEIGNINEIIMMFAFDDANERQRRRESLFKDPAFQVYLQKVRPLLLHQEVRMLVPSKCNPLPGIPRLGPQAS